MYLGELIEDLIKKRDEFGSFCRVETNDHEVTGTMIIEANEKGLSKHIVVIL